MNQNTIAIIWDFDKTLIKGYMQEPLFKRYNINDKEFWKEVNALPNLYAKKNIKVNAETIYLNHMISAGLSYIRVMMAQLRKWMINIYGWDSIKLEIYLKLCTTKLMLTA